jgi:hypothetical protein
MDHRRHEGQEVHPHQHHRRSVVHVIRVLGEVDRQPVGALVARKRCALESADAQVPRKQIVGASVLSERCAFVQLRWQPVLEPWQLDLQAANAQASASSPDNQGDSSMSAQDAD